MTIAKSVITMSILIRETRHWLRHSIDAVANGRDQWRSARQQRRVERLLASNLSHRTYDDDATFDRLQARFPTRPAYAYDAYSCWQRGIERAGRLIKHLGIGEPGLHVLEVGCGDGMLGAVLHGYGHQVTLCDLEDWRDPRAAAIAFHPADVDKAIDLPKASFDVICSYNSFEHFNDPAATLGHFVPLLRPQGRIYLEFGPLYTSPWGLHAFATIRLPYPQLIFSPAFIEQKLREVGIHTLGRASESLQPLNQWRLREFTGLWKGSGCTVEHHETGKNVRFLDLVLEFPQAFCAIDLRYEDLVTEHIAVTLRR